MSNEICWLITLLYRNTLIRVALKINADLISFNWRQYPMEDDPKEFIHSLLPDHIKELGPIVEIEEISEIIVFNNGLK